MSAKQKTVFEGTCQACEGSFVVGDFVVADGVMVFHGYKRPGDGHTVGACLGFQEKPYELSCNLVKKMIGSYQHALEAAERRLVQIEADELDTYYVNEWVHYSERVAGDPKWRMVTIERSDYRFAATRNQEKEEIKGRIEALNNSIVYHTARVAAWKFAPEALRDHTKVEEEKARLTKEARENKLAARQLRRVFTVLKEAVKKHQELTKRIATYKGYGWSNENLVANIARCEEELKIVGPFVRVKGGRTK